METKKIVATQITKSLTGEVENIIDTNDYILEVSNYETMNIDIKNREISISVDNETFKTAVNNVAGEYSFFYNEDDDEWTKGGDFTPGTADLSEYGITVNGTPQNKDSIEIRLDGEGNLQKTFFQATTIFENKLFNFIFFASTVRLGVNLVNSNQWYSLYNTTTRMFTLDTQNNFDLERDLTVYNSSNKDYNVKVIIARKVE